MPDFGVCIHRSVSVFVTAIATTARIIGPTIRIVFLAAFKFGVRGHVFLIVFISVFLMVFITVFITVFVTVTAVTTFVRAIGDIATVVVGVVFATSVGGVGGVAGVAVADLLLLLLFFFFFFFATLMLFRIGGDGGD